MHTVFPLTQSTNKVTLAPTHRRYGNMAMFSHGWKAVTLHGERMPWQIAATFPFGRPTRLTLLEFLGLLITPHPP